MIILSGVLVVVAFALLVAGIVAGDGDSAQVFGVDAIAVIYTSIAVSLVSALFLLVGVFLRRKEIFGSGAAASPRDRKAKKAKKGKTAGPAAVPGAAKAVGDGDPDDEVPIPPQLADVPEDAIVFVVRGRKRYHLDTCRQLAGRDKEELTYAEAREEGFSPCTACLPDTALAARASVSVGAPSAAGESAAKRGDAPSGAASAGAVASAASPSAPPAAPPSVPSAWPTPASSTPSAPSGRDVTLRDIPVPDVPTAGPTLTDIPIPVPLPKPEVVSKPAPEPEPEAVPEPEAAAPQRDEVAEKPSEPTSADMTPEPDELDAPAATVAEKAAAAPVEEPVEEPAEPAAEHEDERAEEPEAEEATATTAPPRPRESSDEGESSAKDEGADAAAEPEKAEADAEPEAVADDEAAETKAEEPAAEEEPQVRILSGTKRYHRPDCALIEDIGDDAEDLESLPRSEAKERGCTPCLVCQPDREHARD